MVSSLGDTINDTLNCGRNLTEGPHFEAGVAELAALQVGHLEAKTPHQLIVDKGRGGSREMRGCETRERSPLDTEHILLFIVGILVECCWFSFHFVLYWKNCSTLRFLYRINKTGLDTLSHHSNE